MWFLVTILGYDLIQKQPHEEIAEFIADLIPDLAFKQDTDEKNYGMILVPRDCFKTTICIIGLVLYLIWKNKDLRAIISSFRHDVAVKRLATVKWHIENNDKFKELCGELKPFFKEQKWAEDAIVVIGREIASPDPTVDTAGVDRSKTGSHVNLILCDDVCEENNVRTALMRQKTLDHIQNFYPQLLPGGTMLVVGTRWHFGDAYGKLLALDDKAEEEGHPRQWKTLIRSVYLYDENHQKTGLYFPTRHTESSLNKVRYQIGDAKFALFYLNQPISDSERLFPRESIATTMFDYFFDDKVTGLPFLRYRDPDTKQECQTPVRVTMAWDPAGIKPTDTSDFHGVSVVGCDPYSRWLVPYAHAIKKLPDEVVAQIAQVILHYEPEVVIIEDVAQSGTWGYLLRSYMQQQGWHCPPIAFYKPPSKVDKFERIRILQPRIKAHEIIFDARSKEVLDQLDNFPQLDYDDVLDSVQMHRDYATPANPDSDDYMYDPDDDLFPKAKKALDDARRKIGAYAGASSATYRSMPGGK